MKQNLQTVTTLLKSPLNVECRYAKKNPSALRLDHRSTQEHLRVCKSILSPHFRDNKHESQELDYPSAGTQTSMRKSPLRLLD